MHIRQLRGWLVRLFGWFQRARREREFAEELDSNLALHIADNLRAGMSPEEAHRRALIKLGSVSLTQERYREQVGLPMIETLIQDLRFGLRMLRKNPGFTAVAVLTLALGIGATTAIFSVIDALMLRRLPVRDPEQLVMLKAVTPLEKRDGFGYPWFERFKEMTQSFAGATAICNQDRSNVTVNGDTDERQVRVGLVTGNYFSLLGVNALMGRTLTPDDDRLQGGHPVTVISYGYWERRLARAPDIVGRALTLQGTTYTILGVTPRGFSGEWVGRPTDMWIPVAMEFQVLTELPPGRPRGDIMGFNILARLNPGVTIEQAQAAAQVVYQQILKERAGPNPTLEQIQWNARSRLELEAATRGHSPQRETFAQPLAILTVMVGLVLLVACANVANLLLARSAARQREMAVRLALGAGRARVVRQLLTESVLLAGLGGMLGVVFAQWATNLLSTFVRAVPVNMGFNTPDPLYLDPHLDGRSLAFTAALCLLTGIVFGLAPAFRGSKVSLAPALTGRGADSGGAISSGSRFGLRKLLVIVQVALSLVLLVGAGLFVRTLRNLQTQDLGVDREHVLLVWAAVRESQRGRGAPVASLFELAQQRISSLPGVVSASPSALGFLNGNRASGYAVRVEDDAPKSGEDPRAQSDLVGPRYFETLGMRLLQGRDFDRRDTETAPRVVIINEAFARHFFGSQNPIGKRMGFAGDVGYPREIVGVVNDAQHFKPRAENRMLFYLPYRQDISHLMSMCLAVRTAVNPTGITARVRQELREIDPSLPVLRIDTVQEQLQDSLTPERLVATLAGFFGVLAVMLACLGLYGVISYSVARRTNEIGIRLALGATPTAVLRMVLKESLWLVLGGMALGVPLALAATRLIASRLFGVSATDPLTMAVAVLLLLAVATLAAFIPARRAASVDPMVALRSE